MNKKLIVILIILILAALGAAASSYALFTYVTETPIGDTVSAGSEGIVTEIGSEYELRLHAFDRYHNSDRPVSESNLEGNKGARESLKLTAGITLNQDLVINRDINLDLGIFSIDLNGYEILIEHPYNGALTIKGTAGVTSFISTGSKGYFTIITPNTYINEVNLSFENIVKTVSPSEEQIVERIFSLSELAGYYYKDLNLMTSYYAHDISFEWTSGDPNIISDGGRIVELPAVPKTVTMTLKLTSPIFLSEHTRESEIVIGSSGDNRLSYGIAELDEFFEGHKYGTDTIYLFRNTWLLKGNDYYGLSYSYQTTFVSYVYEVENPGDYIPDLTADGYILKKNMRSRNILITATVSNSSDTEQKSYPVTVIVEDNLEIANNIVRDLPIYYNSEEPIELPTYEELAHYGVKEAPTFEFIGNDGFYYIEYDETKGKYVIKVNELPDTDDTVYIRMGFTFVTNTPVYVEKDVQIYYIDASGLSGDESLDRFAIMYLLLNQTVNERTAGRTYESFTLPVEVLGYGVSYSIQAPSGFPEDAVVISSDASAARFEIRKINVPVTDTTIIINYHFQGQEGEYTKFSYFVLPGLINNNAIGIPDLALYNAALAAYDSDSDGTLTAAEAAQEKALFTLPESSAVLDGFKGLEFLSRTRGFSFINNSFTKTDAQYLKNNRVLKFLDISGSSLSGADLDMFEDFNYLEELRLSGGTYATLANLKISHTISTLDLSDSGVTNIDRLKDYDSIKTIYIQDNNIKLFDALKEMESLNTVYLYSRTAPVIDSYYGPEGRYNVSTYNLLVKRGVKIYNGYSAGAPVLYVPDPAVAEASAVLESLMINGHTRSSITVPARVYIGTGSSYYQINWDFSTIGTGTASTSNDMITYTHNASNGTYELYASVTVSGRTVYKIFYIKRE